MSDVPSTSAGLPAAAVTLGGIRLGQLPTSGQSMQFNLPRLSPSFAQIPLPALRPSVPVLRFIAPAQAPSIRYVSIAPSGGSFGIPAPLPQRQAPGSVVYLRNALMTPVIPPGQGMPASLKIAPFKTNNTILVPAPSSSKTTPSTPIKKKDPRGRKPMTAMQKAESKKQRNKLKLKGITKGGKRGRPRKTNTLATDYAAEMDDIKTKISNRFESNKKKPVKKEDAGYFGPYIRSFTTSKEAEEEDKGSFGSVPLPNIIIDNFDAHLALPEAAQKSKYKLEKQKDVTLEEPFVCAFCHLDQAAERETAMGDLIGPIVVPGRVPVQKKPGETSTGGGHASVYLHEKCLEWSSNFRMIGFEIVDLQELFDDAKTICSICNRKGATMGCSAPGLCSKTFHYPCAKLSGCKMVSGSHQIYCEKHKVEKAEKLSSVNVKSDVKCVYRSKLDAILNRGMSNLLQDAPSSKRREKLGHVE